MAFDISNLEVETGVEMPKRAGRPSKYGENNPFFDHLTASKNDGQGRAVTVPGKEDSDNVKTVVGMLRYAGRQLDYGVRINTETKGNRTTVKFQATDPVRRPRKNKETTDA